MSKCTVSSKESDHFQKLIEALYNVDSSYMYIDADLDDLQVERCFAYELYHQWRKKISDAAYKENYPDIILNGEISKSIEGSSTTYPDMVLHDGQDTERGNYLICEIKRNKTSDEKIADDIYKLSDYLNFTTRYFNNTHVPIEYDEAAFIMFGIDFNDLRKKIKGEIDINRIDVTKQEKIKIISVNYSNNKSVTIVYDSLINILN